VGALAQKDVGDYLNKYFVASYLKVSNFTIASNGKKQGGNVASYFCTPDGRVLHAVVGPVSGRKLLDEARWVEEMWKLAEMQEIETVAQLQSLYRAAHLERLAKEFRLKLPENHLPALEPDSVLDGVGRAYVNLLLNRSPDQEAKVHLLLAAFSAPKIAMVYRTVFETILGQEISTTPVVQKQKL
jgi:hypothetical protein